MCECGKPDCIGHPNGDTTLPGRTSGVKHIPPRFTCCSNPDCIGHPNGDPTFPGRTSGNNIKHTEKSPDSLKCCVNPLNCTLTCCYTERQTYVKARELVLEGNMAGKMVANF